MLRCEQPCRTGEAWLVAERVYAITVTSGFRNTVYGLAPGIGCAGQWLASLKATDGGNEEKHEQQSQEHHVDCPSSDNLRQRGRVPDGGFCSSGVGV